MRGRRSDLVPRAFKVTFSQEQADALDRWRSAAGMPDMATAVRTAVDMALAFDPEEGFRQSAYNRAFNETRRWSQSRLAEVLMEMADQLKLMAGTSQGE